MHIVVIGAGLGGLSCAVHLAGAGRQVTVLEREHAPGGSAGRSEVMADSEAGGRYQFDIGPTVLTMPEVLADTFGAVDEKLSDWLELVPLDPVYRAHYPDGSTLDVRADAARMAEEVSRVCGHREATGYLRFVDFTRRLWHLERNDFIARNLDSPRDLLTANLLRLIAAGGFRRLSSKIGQFFTDPRTRQIFSFQAMYAGLAPHEALAIYAVIAYLDTVAGVFYPRGGVHAVPLALAAAAEKHGVRIRYDTPVSRVEAKYGRATAVLTADGERIPADAVVLNPDLPAAYRDLLPGPVPPRLSRLRFSPSCVVLHAGSRQAYRRIAHHNVHFGREWRTAFDEIIHQGRLMTDPSLLVTNPSQTDPSVAPTGRQTYYVLAPTPNLSTGTQDWADDSFTARYTDELLHTLEQRGYVGFRDGIEVSRMVTPADWALSGLSAGTPFAAAHTLWQTGPFRPGNRHPTLDNVIFVGAGTQPGVGVPMVLISGKLAASRIIGAVR